MAKEALTAELQKDSFAYLMYKQKKLLGDTIVNYECKLVTMNQKVKDLQGVDELLGKSNKLVKLLRTKVAELSSVCQKLRESTKFDYSDLKEVLHYKNLHDLKTDELIRCQQKNHELRKNLEEMELHYEELKYILKSR